MPECCQLKVWGEGVKAISRCMWGGGPCQGTSGHVSQQALGQAAGEKDETGAGRGTDPKWFPVASSLLLFSADHFVVSVPTEVSGRFSEMKILFFSGEW